MKKFIFAAMAALAITSCSQSEEMDAPSQKVEIGFNSFVGKGTRATPMLDADFTNFKVYAYNTGTKGITTVTNLSTETAYIAGKDVTKTENAWGAIPGGPYYWPATDKLQFFAYSPAASVVTYAVTGQYPTFEYTVKAVENQEDLLAASATDQTKKDNATGVDLSFKHLLTQVNFSVKGETSGYAYTVKKIEITGVNSKATFTFASDGGSWANAEAPVASYEYFNGTQAVTADPVVDLSTGTNALMLMPQALPTGAVIKVTYKVNNGIFDIYDDTAEVSISGTSWAANKKIRYTLTLKDNGTVVKLTPSVDPWEAPETPGTTNP